MKCKILLDTSILLMLYEGVDIIEEIENTLGTKCEFYVLIEVLNELRRLSEVGIGWRSKAASMALQYIKGRIKVVEQVLEKNECSDVDEAIVNAAKKYGSEFIYATADKELKRKLRELNVPVLTWWLGKRKFVVIT